MSKEQGVVVIVDKQNGQHYEVAILLGIGGMWKNNYATLKAAVHIQIAW